MVLNFHELLRVPVRGSDYLKFGKLKFKIDLENIMMNVPVVDSLFSHCNGYPILRFILVTKRGTTSMIENPK